MFIQGLQKVDIWNPIRFQDCPKRCLTHRIKGALKVYVNSEESAFETLCFPGKAVQFSRINVCAFVLTEAALRLCEDPFVLDHFR